MHWIGNLKKASLTLAVAAAVAVLGSASGTRAATIKWGRATDVSGDANVSTAGKLVSAYSFTGVSTPPNPVVNGVTFTGLSAADSRTSVTFGGDTITSSSTMGSISTMGAPSGFSSAYKTLLTSTYYPNTGIDPLTLTLNKLAPGKEYQFEVWVNDTRTYAGAGARTETVGATGDLVTLAYHTGKLGAGQVVLGTFTADSTGRQVITFTGNVASQINAFQLRTIPEPRNRKQAQKEVRVSGVTLPPVDVPGTPGVTLTADTSHPATSTFVIDRPVGLTFRVRGDKPPEKDLRLDVKIVGANGRLVRKENLAVVPNAAGDWMGTIAGPDHRFGFYRVYAHLSDGVTLPKLGARPAGYLTYCVVPDPAKRPFLSFKDNFFGMDGSANVDILPYLGVRLVSGQCNWGTMEPVRAGQFAAKIAAAKKTGKFPPQLALLRSQLRWSGSQHMGGSKEWKVYSSILNFYLNPPHWATIAATRGGDTAALTPAGEKAWASYCREVGRFFAGRRGGWHIYQITWEPDYPWGFKGTNRQLIRIYQIAFKALHATDPRAMVFGPTYSGIQMGEVAKTIKLLKEGLGKYLDGISIHPYIGFPPEKNGLLQSVRKLKTAIYKYTGKHLPMIGTEEGFWTKGHESKELSSAQGLIRANLILLGEGFQFNYAFYLTDFPNPTVGNGFGLYYNLVPGLVYFPDKIGPRPAAPAYAAMTFLLTGYKSVGTIQWLGPDTLGYAFQRGSDIVLALWDYGNTPRKVTIPTGVKTVKVYDWMGNSQMLHTTASRQIVLTLGPEPTYIRGVSPAIWGVGAIRPLTVAKNNFRVFPGQKVAVWTTVATATGRPGTGRLALTLVGKGLSGGAVSRSVALGKSPAKVALALVLPKGLRAGHYTARLSLTQGKTVVAVTGVRINVISPVEVISARPAFKNGKPFVAVGLRNRTPVAATVHVALGVKAMRALIPGQSVTLKPGASAHVSFDMSALKPADNRFYTFHVRATVGGCQSTTDFNLSFNPVPWVAAPLGMHVPLHNWGTGPVVALAGRSHIVRSPQYYKGHLAARVRFAWDKSNLYIAFNVTDPVYIQRYTGFNTWNGDCLQLEFNLDPGKKAAHTGNASFDEASIRRTEIDVALTSKGPQAYRTYSYSGAELPVEQLPQSQCHIAVWRTAKGLDYRMAIPWKTLGANHAPRPGRCVGFAAYVNAVNTPAQPDPTALGLFVRNAAKNPRQFGTLILLGEGK